MFGVGRSVAFPLPAVLLFAIGLTLHQVLGA